MNFGGIRFEKCMESMFHGKAEEGGGGRVSMEKVEGYLEKEVVEAEGEGSMGFLK